MLRKVINTNIFPPFQEKEYPDNMEQIKHLKEEISYLEEDFEENLSHLARIAAVEEKDFKEHAANRIKNVTAIFAEVRVQEMRIFVQDGRNMQNKF